MYLDKYSPHKSRYPDKSQAKKSQKDIQKRKKNEKKTYALQNVEWIIFYKSRCEWICQQFVTLTNQNHKFTSLQIQIIKVDRVGDIISEFFFFFIIT